MTELTPDGRQASERKFVVAFALAAAFVAAIPALFALLGTPAGAAYLGFQYNTDDHMVYSAWMRQATDGRVLFDNRFAVDPQPGLTVHLYYLVLGFLAKLTGIALASHIARLGFSVLFVFLAYRLARRLEGEIVTTKLAVGLSVVGGGLGFLVWHTFGGVIVKPSPLSGVMLSRLPTDVWQPEGFVFPSMLTNGLFMVSLCLIVFAFLCFLDARTSWRPVLPGALALGTLMNIHSYDVLLVAFVMVGFLVATAVRKQATGAWIGRAALIGAGAVPPALWFVNVLRQDPVFQARAATETFSPNFRQVLFGYGLMVLLALAGLAMREEGDRKRRLAGVGLVVLLYGGLFVAAAQHLTPSYFVSLPAWIGIFAVALVAVALLADENPAWNLLTSWAVIGMVAIYFPGLFQRKLAMGLSVPWAILAAFGLHAMLRRQERSSRNLVLALGMILLAASSLRWTFREIELIGANVSNTTLHPVYLNSDVRRIVQHLNTLSGRHVLIAPPGIPSPVFAQNQQETVARNLLAPPVPDLNPIASGLAGVYTYAGHWSETPDYLKRRGRLSSLYFQEMPEAERVARLKETGASYMIALAPEAFPDTPLYDFRSKGEVVVDGSQFRLLRLAQ